MILRSVYRHASKRNAGVPWQLVFFRTTVSCVLCPRVVSSISVVLFAVFYYQFLVLAHLIGVLKKMLASRLWSPWSSPTPTAVTFLPGV